MSRATGAVRTAWSWTGLKVGDGLRWLRLAEGGSPRAAGAVSRRYVPEPVRRAGRWLVVRGWASAVVWPGRWAAGGAVAGLVLGGLSGLLIGGAMPLAATPLKLISGLRPRCNFPILYDVSSRVNTLKLARRLRKGWEPEMRRLGLTQQRERRGEQVTVVPKLGKLQLGPYGVSGEVDLHPLRLIVADLDNHRQRLESAFLARCLINGRGYATALVEFRHTDPLSKPVPVEALPLARRHLHIVTRIAEDGQPIEQDVVLPRLIIGGQGSGKSYELWLFLWALQRAGIPFRLRVFDPKGGMELGALKGAAHVYEARPYAWPAFIGDAVTAMQSRQRSLAGRGWRKLTRFTDAEPLDIVVVDELLAVLGQRQERVSVKGGVEMSAGDDWNLYLSQGRAAGYTAVALTQLGQKELLGHARGLFPHLTVLRLPPTEKEIVDRLIGPEYPAHLIPPNLESVGYARTPEGRVVRSRGGWLSDDELAEVVELIAADKQRREDAKRARREKAGAAA